ERQPVERAVGLEFGDRELALIEQRAIGLTVGRIERFARNEAVEILPVIVISHIDDNSPVLVEDDGGPFMLHAAESGALDRNGIRLIGVDLDHPMETVHLVGLLLDIEPIVKAREAIIIGRLISDALHDLLVGRLCRIAAEEVISRLLASKDRAPRRVAAAAIGERALD